MGQSSIEKDCFRLFQAVVTARDRICVSCRSCPSQVGHHIFSRSGKSTAFDPLNGLGLCHECHTFVTNYPSISDELAIEILGQEAFDDLRRRYWTPARLRDHDFRAIKKGLQETLEALLPYDNPRTM